MLEARDVFDMVPDIRYADYRSHSRFQVICILCVMVQEVCDGGVQQRRGDREVSSDY